MKNCRKIVKNSEYNGKNGEKKAKCCVNRWMKKNEYLIFEGTKTQFEIKMLFFFMFKIVYLELIERDTEVRNLR